MPTVGVEWINAYDNLNPLTHEHEDAGGLYDELINHDGWTGVFNWGDGNAWEEDFKRADKGGTAGDWAERVDLAYFTGHGSPWGFYFRSDSPDDTHSESDHWSGPDNGDLRLGTGDLDWLALEVCNTLQYEASSRDVFDRWASAFQGLHTMLSFTTLSLDLPTPGRYFAAFCDGRWVEVIFGFPFFSASPLRVVDSWFLMGQFCQPDEYETAALFANTEGTDTGADYLHGHGYVSPDPRPGAANWFSWTWVPHTC
jgi:hypothetical protein